MAASRMLDGDLEALFGRSAFHIKPGLERISALLADLGDPHHHYLVIHIAGTNGKGSVAALLESILRAAGFKTGLYTSPHLFDYRERIKIGGDPVSEELLKSVYSKVMESDRKCVEAGGDRASFFEMTTAIAFECFRDSAINAAVVETGMGGRWDATNIVQPIVTAITPIAIEHSQRLGTNIAQIAGEKAGIIKPGVPVVVADQKDEAIEVISRTASEKAAPLRLVAETLSAACTEFSLDGQKLKIETSSHSYPPILCPLLGEHQIGNTALALATAEEFFAACAIDLPLEAVKQGIENVSWPARGQVIGRDPLCILDGAHNPAAAEKLAALLKRLAGGRKLGLIVSFLEDKDADGFMGMFAGMLKRCWIVEIDSKRAMSAEKISSAVAAVTREYAVAGREEAYAEALEWARSENGILCVTGSLYLAGEFLK